MSRPRTLLSWSSGKDSAWALHRLRAADAVELVALVTTMNEVAGRVAMHAVREALQLPQLVLGRDVPDLGEAVAVV